MLQDINLFLSLSLGRRGGGYEVQSVENVDFPLPPEIKIFQHG